MEPSDQQIEDLRAKFFQKLENDTDPDRFHPVDIAKIKNGNDWLRRFLIHVDMDSTAALQYVWDSCEWRKLFGTNDINENNVKREYLEEGNMFVHNRDVDGRSILIMKSKKHIKGQKNMDELKRCTVYWFERLERMDKGEQITIFFDMADTGLSNMDMEYTKYLINLFKAYYPDFLNYILVFEMPWILNAAFKIIKTWLPAKAVQKIKFVGKSNLKEFVAVDQMLACWGGSDDYDYTFIPEERLPVTDKQEEYKKKVHFADGSPMVETYPGFGDANNSVFDTSGSSNSSLKIVPHDSINFMNDGTELTGSITLSNVGDKIISYKIKTTSPEKFRVRPSSGTLTLGGAVTINVLLQPGYQLPALTRDKFLIMHLPVLSAGMSANEIADLWKQSAGKNIEQHRLKCSVAVGQSIESSIRNGTAYGTMSTPDTPERQIAQLVSKVNQLNENHAKLHRDLRFGQKMNWFTAILVLFFGVAILYVLKYETILSNQAPYHSECYTDTQ